MDKMKLLDQLVIENKYLLHGSPLKVEILEPKIPQNTSPNAYIEKGVYATDTPELAAFISILNTKKLPESGRFKNKIIYSWYKSEDRWRFGVTKNVVTYEAYSKGYIYVLNRDLFRKLHIQGEYLCSHEIKPSSIVEIEPSDFLRYFQVSILPVSYLRQSKAVADAELEMMGY